MFANFIVYVFLLVDLSPDDGLYFPSSFYAQKFLLNARHCKFYVLGGGFCCMLLSGVALYPGALLREV